MANISLPSISWKTARMLLWSGIITIAALDVFNLVDIPQPLAGFMDLVYIAAVWVISYNLLQRFKG